MPAASDAKYMTNAPHWHQPERVKRCILCGQSKPLSSFYAYGYTTRQGKQSTRYDSRCKVCAVERAREQTRAHPGKNSRQSRSWREQNREAHLEGLARYRMTERGRRAKAKGQRVRKARIRSGQGDTPEIRAIYAQAMQEEALILRCPVFDLPELGKKLHVDHRIPLAKGGKHEASNLQILPIGINLRKGTSCPL
jgi:5-methylcytosine-specific restriction endonuclease McrA